MNNEDQERHNSLARKVIQGLLDDKPPDGINPAECGPWAEIVAGLCKAYAEGGRAKVRDVFSALARAEPGLVRLVASDPSPVKTRWTAAELLGADFPEPRWAVPGLLPVGLTFLAGRPKIGKSWLALQMAHAIGTGGKVLDRDVEQGAVLYLALEDSPRRLKNRLSKQGATKAAAITFHTAWRNLNEGGLADLQAEIERGPFRLIVIDTLSRAVGRADQQDIAEMTVILGNLQQMAMLYDVAILLIDHHRKSSGLAPDPVDDIMGSTAKAAVADAALGIFREQGKHGAILKVTGRDLEEQDLALAWDGLTCTWQLLGAVGEVRKETAQAEVISAIGDLTEMGEVPYTARIAQHMGKDKGNVSRALADLVKAGQVIKGEKDGRTVPYYLPEHLGGSEA